jgi:hypothetical protein
MPAMHEPGRFSTADRGTSRRGSAAGIERGTATYLAAPGQTSSGLTPGTWASQMVHQRGIEGVRVLMGLLSLAKRHPTDRIEQACRTGLHARSLPAADHS